MPLRLPLGLTLRLRLLAPLPPAASAASPPTSRSARRRGSLRRRRRRLRRDLLQRRGLALRLILQLLFWRLPVVRNDEDQLLYRLLLYRLLLKRLLLRLRGGLPSAPRPAAPSLRTCRQGGNGDRE